MAHGFGDVPERDSELRRIGSNTGRLVDGECPADPYTGIPRMSAIPVSIERAAAAPGYPVTGLAGEPGDAA